MFASIANSLQNYSTDSGQIQVKHCKYQTMRVEKSTYNEYNALFLWGGVGGSNQNAGL